MLFFPESLVSASASKLALYLKSASSKFRERRWVGGGRLYVGSGPLDLISRVASHGSKGWEKMALIPV